MRENENKEIQESSLLFAEAPEKSEAYMRDHKTKCVTAAVLTAVFLILGLVCLFMKFWAVALVPLMFAILLGMLWVKSVLQKKQYLYVYEDKIRYKTAFKEKQIFIAPSEYGIELRHTVPRSGYTVKFIFIKPSGEKILTYKAVSLVPSLFQAEKHPWEKELFAVGCEIIDRQEIIINK